ncbi:MAG: hypothetical protein R3C45_17720 [Phycisphaerales bacterium]
MKTPRIDELVRRTGRSLWMAEAGEWFLRALLAVIVVFLAAVVVDAGYALPVVGVVLLDVLLLGVAGFVAWPVVVRLARGRPRDRQTAVYIEKRLQVPDNRLINALDIAEQDAAGMSAALRDEVIARGEAAAAESGGRSVIDREALKRAALPAVIAVVGLILAYVVMPSVFHAVVPRLVAPFADLPPFTLVKFDIHTDPQPIYHGKPGTIRVTLSGPGVHDQAQVVFLDESEQPAPLPMYRVSSARTDKVEPGESNTFAMRVDRVEGARRFYIRTPRGRSAVHTLTANTSPLIEQAHATYSYPAYTGWRGTTGAITPAGIRTLTGTQVALHIVSNVPLGGGELKLSPADETDHTVERSIQLIPDADDPRAAQLTFPMDVSGRFELTLTGADGKPGVDTLAGKLTALPDRAPKIDIVDPQRQVVAPEGWQIEAHITAGDDIGVGPITLHHGLNDNPTTPTPLPATFTDKHHTVTKSDYTFDLAETQAKAGDVVKYYAAVNDNRPGTPQSAETPIYAIHIITLEQYMDIARSQYRIDDINREFEAILERLGDLEAQRNQLLEQLAALKEQIPFGEPLTDAQRQAMAKLESTLNKYAEEAASLADALSERAEQASLYEFEDAYKQMLSDLSKQIKEQSEQSGSLADTVRSMRDAGNADQLALTGSAMREQADRFEMLREPFAGGQRERTQTAREDLERLQLAEAMMAQGERIRRVAQEQDELAVRLAALAEPRSLTAEEQRRADALAQEQARLREELSDAARALREAAENASGLLPNMSGGALSVADRIDELRIVPTQMAVENASLSGNGPLAHQAALEAAEKLDSLLSDVQQNQAQASIEMDGCFNLPRQNMQNALQQMASARKVPGIGSQGGSGAGMSGAMATMSMVGPSVPGQPGGDSLTREGRRGGRGGRGDAVSSEVDVDMQAEVIHTDASDNTATSALQLPGVPVVYREQAAAYFRRIAEEEK